MNVFGVNGYEREGKFVLRNIKSEEEEMEMGEFEKKEEGEEMKVVVEDKGDMK